MTEAKKGSNQVLKLTLILALVSAIVSLVLGFVDYITRDRIAEINTAKTNAAFAEVLKSDSYSFIDGSASGFVTGVYDAGGAGHVVQLNVSGSQGTIDLVVGIDSDGVVTGVSIISHSETSGLGSRATDPAFREQYVGASGSVALDKNGGNIAALSGATVTSKAVTNAVNIALDTVKALG